MALSDNRRAGSSYASLLQALKPSKPVDRAAKRRKLSHTTGGDEADPSRHLQVNGEGSSTVAADSVSEELEDVLDEAAPEDEPQVGEGNQSDEDENVADPFEQHFASATSAEIEARVAAAASTKSESTNKTIPGDLKRIWIPYGDGKDDAVLIRTATDVHLKQRLASNAATLLGELHPFERDAVGAIYSYKDVVAGNRTVNNIPQLRDVCALHSLNHVFKTRDRILRNTTKLARSEGGDLELRDQGFTRPKVLVILPTKQSCVRFADSVVKFSGPEQQENKARFLAEYSRDDTDEWLEKPEDFRELFGGNHEEDFRIGLKFTRKTIKYFSSFYDSDIILCSPLGLFRAISSGASKEGKKTPDADFLSSIEILIVDHASSLQMQNWQHVDFILDRLNALPKESHGCDFSRVRSWYLDDKAKHLRQTIVMSSFLTPEINRLVTKHSHNIAGRLKYVPTYSGAMTDVPNLLPIPVAQTFVRFDSTVAVKDSDMRFKHFCASILPQLARDKSSKGVLVFIPTYADFTRLRNHLTNSTEGASISFGSISEYSSVKETHRARSHFLKGGQSLLLYTERAHHHFRYRLKGVRKVVFYGLPENPVFYTELVALLGLNRDLVDSNVAGGKASVRAMFSKWDALKLERVVGTERVGRLLSEGSGDTFDFV